MGAVAADPARRARAGYDKQASETEMGDGDGTVNIASLELATPRWANLSFGVDQLRVRGVSHFDMTSDPAVLAHLNGILAADARAEP